jgi:succinylglutamate desuccinylase
VFVDLHTSSADGPPFVCMADTVDNRRVALASRVPIILGIEETIDGASLEWFSSRGIVNFAVEGGRHGHPDTVGNHEAVLWLLLEHCGLLARGAVDTAPHRRHLQKATAGMPAIVEIVHRRVIAPPDQFAMLPGFTNFMPVRPAQLLAHDVRGEIRADRAGRILLPLYQALGDDGFFLARDVRPFWLSVAAALRRLRLHRRVDWLPGVSVDPTDRNTILVNPAVARWFVTEVFHLLGFRKERQRGDKLAFTRRWSLPHNRRIGPRAPDR